MQIMKTSFVTDQKNSYLNSLEKIELKSKSIGPLASKKLEFLNFVFT